MIYGGICPGREPIGSGTLWVSGGGVTLKIGSKLRVEKGWSHGTVQDYRGKAGRIEGNLASRGHRHLGGTRRCKGQKTRFADTVYRGGLRIMDTKPYYLEEVWVRGDELWATYRESTRKGWVPTAIRVTETGIIKWYGETVPYPK